MRYPKRAPSSAEHDRRNELQLLIFKRERRDLYDRLVADLTAESRAHLEERIARMEAEEAAAA